MKKLLMTCALIFSCFQTSIYSESQDKYSNFTHQLSSLSNEIDSMDSDMDKEQSQLLKKIIKTNIDFIESKVLHKLKHAEERLAKYKNLMSDASIDPEESEELLEKVNASEEKIKNLNDIILIIQKLKAKV
ncbi:MAG: hypothetical protein H0W88_00320 [Parachlamydiaceae bacterium]|nr:hypothetical protein [Parachlamydiaceae bacterium]